MTLSDELAAVRRPFRALAEIGAREPPTAREAVAKIAFALFVVGAFVSLVTAGRLVAFHVASTMIAYAFAPGLQLLALLVVRRFVVPGEPIPRLVVLHAAGFGPWLLTLLALAALCVLAPDVYVAFFFLLERGVLPILVLLTFAWSGVLTYAAFARGLGLGRAKAARATALYYLVYVGSVVAYYLAANQIQPQIAGPR